MTETKNTNAGTGSESKKWQIFCLNCGTFLEGEYATKSAAEAEAHKHEAEYPGHVAQAL